MAKFDLVFLLCIAKFLAFDIAIACSCVGFGHLFDGLLRNCTKNLDSLFFRSVLGAGVWTGFVFTAGLMHAISKISLLTFFALSLVLLLLRWFRKQTSSRFEVDWLSLGLMAAAFVASFWYSLYPARFYDDLNYNLPLARYFLETHSIDPAWHLRFPVGSQATQLLFVPLQAFGGDIAAQQLSVVSFQLLLLGIFCCAKRFARSVKAGQIALLACLTGAHVLELSPTAYTDMNFALFVSAGIYSGLCLLDARTKESKRTWVILCGICFGLSINSYLLGLVPFIIFLVQMLAETLTRSKENDGSEKLVDLKNFGVLILVALLVTAPFFIRTLNYTHNPVFPFAWDYFGLGGVWNVHDAQTYIVELRRDYGLSKDLFDIINLPWLLSFPPEYFFEPSLTPTLLLALVVGFPLSFFPHSETIRRLLILICAAVLAWFFFGHHTTYLLGIVSAVSVLTGISVFHFWRYVTDRPTQRFWITFCTAAVLVFGAVGHSLAFLGKYCDPIAATAAIRSELLDRWLPINRTFEFANQLPVGNLYTYRNPDIKYLYKGTTFGDYYGQARFDDFATAAHNGQTLTTFLKKFDVQYLIVDPSLSKDLPSDEAFKMHFHQLFLDPAGVLYKVD